MVGVKSNIDNENLKSRSELLFALQQRQEATLFFVSTDSYAQRDEILGYLQKEVREYQYHSIDLTPFDVTSLHQTLKKNLPKEILKSKPVTYIVNIFGLENSLLISEDGNIIPSALTGQLNFERENLFDVPYITILWGDSDFFNTLQKEAPDLCHWVNYIYHFEDEANNDLEQEQQPLPQQLDKRGFTEERAKRIKELETKYKSIRLNDKNKQRLNKDKIDLLSLIGKEYEAMPDYNKAKEKLEIALKLTIDSKQEDYTIGKLYFELGSIELGLRNFEKALEAYSMAKGRLQENNFGNVYHQIGIVFEEQRKWKQAIENYQTAIEWNIKVKNEFQLGNNYHQMGMVFQMQRKWKQAIENYQTATEWDQKTGNEFQLSNTYHQIGRVFEEQQKWKQAIENYQTAIQWKNKTSNEFQLGNTYHQIGRLFEKQEKWKQASEYYQTAIEWNTKTGNQFELGSTYHQIGMVFQTQRKWKQAIENYQTAIEWKNKTGNQFELGSTYHQIGMVFQTQRKWKQAIENYQTAIDWNTKTGNEFELGITYHQIGRVFEGQRKWKKAIENYQTAIDWNNKTGNEFELGGTYHQIGKNYKETGELTKAQEYLEKAVVNLNKFENPNLEVAKRSLERIKQKIVKKSSLK